MVVGIIAVELAIDLWYKLQVLGIPIEGLFLSCGDNK